MNDRFFENPILNSPYRYPGRHWELDGDGQPTRKIVESHRFTRGFLVATPGLTIRDRLRVLKPNDPDSYYRSRDLVPHDLLPDLDRAKIVITNYHAFRRRERIEIAKGGRSLLQGRGPAPDTRESEGRMLRRVMPELMGVKNVLVLNDEAHHCYREKRGEGDEAALRGDERKEAEKNREAARLWVSGLEAVHRKLGVGRVIDLSATPFFLSGSGYAEGTLFPWTMCDFSLMDAIECGIVKLPRVPVADNVPGNEMPMYRELWKHIRTRMPGQGRGKAGGFLDPANLPPELRTARISPTPPEYVPSLSGRLRLRQEPERASFRPRGYRRVRAPDLPSHSRSRSVRFFPWPGRCP